MFACSNTMQKFFGVLQRVHDFSWLAATNSIAFGRHEIAKNLWITSKFHYNDTQSEVLRNTALF